MEGRISKKEASGVLSNTIMFYMTSELYSDYVWPFNRDTYRFDMEKYCKLMDINLH